MDLLGVANRINSELAYIRASNEYVLSENERADLFNSIIVCLTEGLIDEITLVIRDRDTNSELLRWGYNLRGGQYSQRIGPEIREIIATVERAMQKAYLSYEVEWSAKYRSMSPHSQQRLLRDTVWNRDRRQSHGETRDPGDSPVHQPQERIDLRDLELDLRRLESDTGSLDGQMVRKIMTSVQKTLSNRSIVGVQLVLRKGRGSGQTVEWAFEVQPGVGLVRRGPPIDRILAILRELRGRTKVEVWPIPSVQFKQLPPERQLSAMEGTVWEAEFQKQNKRKWWSE